jgi:hypothetical protein
MANKSRQRARALAAKTGMKYQAAVNQLRKSRVVPDFAGFTTTTRLFLRPFDAIAQGHNDTTLPIRAEIRGRQFVVQVLGQEVEIAPIEILRDKKGAVAVIEPREYALRDGFTLELQLDANEAVSPEFEPDMAALITVRREGSLREAVRNSAEERFGPVNLVAPYETHFSLYFHADGTLEDWQRRDRPRVAGPRLPAATSQNVPLDAFGRVAPDDSSQPELEWVNVQDFDATDFDRTAVPDAAYEDPSMQRDPSWPPGEKVLRVPSLNEYIAAREKQTGWKLMEVRPGPALDLTALLPPSPRPLPEVVTSVTLVWNRQPSQKGVA